MKLFKMSVGSYQANCYVLTDDSNETVMIDPGDEPDAIEEKIIPLKDKLRFILLTHGHADHTGAVSYFAKKYDIPVYISKFDYDFMKRKEEMFGNIENDVKINFIKDNQKIRLGSSLITCIETPGHTEGGVCFRYKDILFTGDTVFKEAAGRWDFPGGNYEKLMKSIKNKIKILPDETVFYPGHGPKTDMLHEKENNPFFR